MFEIGNILTLADDNEYSVVDKFNDNGIVELSDADELEKIIKLVYEHIHKN